MKMNTKNILAETFLILLLFSNGLQAQDTITIRGTVKNSVTKEGIFNVQIFVKDSKIGTTTNLSGGFDLTFKPSSADITITFRHIAFDSLEFTPERIQAHFEILLTPRVIPLSELEVIEKPVYSEIGKDLPQSITVFKAEKFKHLSFDDAGELLRNEQGIQVEDELNGQKNISMRGGNSDETIVMYNGIKLNSTYNNIADVSLIDLQDIEKVEVIRGSNTIIYGSAAFSGVINIVPKLNEKYHIRFRQKIGAYDSGQWTLNLNGTIGNLTGFVSTREGASVRFFATQGQPKFQIRNNSEHFTGNVRYQLTDNSDTNSLYGTMLTTTKNYVNERDVESLAIEEDIFSSRFVAYFPAIQDIEFKVSKRSFEQSHKVTSVFGSLTRDLSEQSFNFSVDKPIEIGMVEQRFIYQIDTAELDFSDIRGSDFINSISIERKLLNRTRHGFVSITKFHQKSTSDYVDVTDFDISFRREYLKDTQDQSLSSDVLLKVDNEIDGDFQEENSFKFSFNIAGGKDNINYNTYLNFGTNFKFPSLSQKISSVYLRNSKGESINFNPEKVSSNEIGIEIFGSMPEHEIIDTWEIKSNIFRNIYDNKIRVTFPIGVPVPIFDNVRSVKISGVETNFGAKLYKKKLDLNIGFSKYFISEKSAFPFKYDSKLSAAITYNHAGYSSYLTVFREGDQVGWIKNDEDELDEIILPSFSNIDLHLSKTVIWNNFNMNINLSGINLLTDDLVIQGLALRDRRFYLSVGIEY